MFRVKRASLAALALATVISVIAIVLRQVSGDQVVAMVTALALGGTGTAIGLSGAAYFNLRRKEVLTFHEGILRDLRKHGTAHVLISFGAIFIAASLLFSMGTT